MKSTYGSRAKEVAIAVSQTRGGLSLAQIGEVVGAPASSIQRALESLTEDGLVRTARTSSSKRYGLHRSAAAQAFLTYALLTLPSAAVVSIVCRANPAVEFAGRDTDGLFVVLSPFAEPGEVVLLVRALRELGFDEGAKTLELVDRPDLRRRLLDDAGLLARGRSLSVVKGSAIRTFRDPRQHGSATAKPLGRLHESLKRPSQRRLRAIANRNRLGRLSAFGSAVRDDFRPESDVDILVEAQPGERLSLTRLMNVQRELEDIFGRDVDVVTAASLREEARARADRDEVRLYG